MKEVMKFIVGKRQSGKTTKLLEFAAKKQAVFVVRSRDDIAWIKKRAKQLKLDIPDIITFHNFLKDTRCSTRKYVINDLEFCLSEYGVIGANFTEDENDPCAKIKKVHFDESNFDKAKSSLGHEVYRDGIK